MGIWAKCLEKWAPRAGLEPAPQRLTDTCLASGAAFYCCADFCAAALAVCFVRWPQHIEVPENKWLGDLDSNQDWRSQSPL